MRQPPNHITATGSRYDASARDSDICCLVEPLSAVVVVVVVVVVVLLALCVMTLVFVSMIAGILGSMSTRGGTSGGGDWTTFGICGTGWLGSYPEDSSRNPSSSSVIGSSSSTPSPDPLPEP